MTSASVAPAGSSSHVWRAKSERGYWRRLARRTRAGRRKYGATTSVYTVEEGQQRSSEPSNAAPAGRDNPSQTSILQRPDCPYWSVDQSDGPPECPTIVPASFAPNEFKKSDHTSLRSSSYDRTNQSLPSEGPREEDLGQLRKSMDGFKSILRKARNDAVRFSGSSVSARSTSPSPYVSRKTAPCFYRLLGCQDDLGGFSTNGSVPVEERNTSFTFVWYFYTQNNRRKN